MVEFETKHSEIIKNFIRKMNNGLKELVNYIKDIDDSIFLTYSGCRGARNYFLISKII